LADEACTGGLWLIMELLYWHDLQPMRPNKCFALA
jgi:hypothetical protein